MLGDDSPWLSRDREGAKVIDNIGRKIVFLKKDAS